MIEHTEPSEKKLPPSLRKVQDEDEQFNLFRVTPEFQNHVAKHLSKALEQKLQKLLTSATHIDNIPRKKRRKSCVKLFKSSKKFLKIDKNNIEDTSSDKTNLVHRPFSKVGEQVDETLLKQVAVDPQAILSKKDTKFWSNRSKAPIYNYRKSSEGSLVLIESAFK